MWSTNIVYIPQYIYATSLIHAVQYLCLSMWEICCHVFVFTLTNNPFIFRHIGKHFTYTWTHNPLSCDLVFLLRWMGTIICRPWLAHVCNNRCRWEQRFGAFCMHHRPARALAGLCMPDLSRCNGISVPVNHINFVAALFPMLPHFLLIQPGARVWIKISPYQKPYANAIVTVQCYVSVVTQKQETERAFSVDSWFYHFLLGVDFVAYEYLLDVTWECVSRPCATWMQRGCYTGENSLLMNESLVCVKHWCV